MYTIINADAIEGLMQLPDESVDCCITSPPYYNLRDYGNEKQIGLEKSPYEYIDKLVEVFKEVKRVLKKDGTLWINISDSYAKNGKGAAVYKASGLQATNKGSTASSKIANCNGGGVRPKNLIGIPWMLAFRLRDELGYYLRQDIIWSKPNPMPESVKDRFTKSHEYIFLLSKSSKYYFDQESIKEKSLSIAAKDKRIGLGRLHYRGKREEAIGNQQANFVSINETKNKRSVWNVSVTHLKLAHFATFPVKLIEPCVLAGSRIDGIVLDPFCGSGTTGVVALMHSRRFIGIDINSEYCQMAKERIEDQEK